MKYYHRLVLNVHLGDLYESMVHGDLICIHTDLCMKSWFMGTSLTYHLNNTHTCFFTPKWGLNVLGTFNIDELYAGSFVYRYRLPESKSEFRVGPVT